jgi:pimeloyl-ACP methyl ester carboxylesterase
MSTNVERVASTDGTAIAVESVGEGPAVVLIGGAFNDRTTTRGLAQLLSPYYRAVIYDRRGRGESGDERGEFSVDREIEDLRAVVDHVGGTASLFGHSSGAVLALEAAVRGLPVEKVAAYEPPYIPERSRPRPARDVFDRLVNLVRTDDRDGATRLFYTEVIGLPPEMVEGMRQSDAWGGFTGLAHSLPYDCALFEPGYPVPTGRLAGLEVPTLVITGSQTFPWLATAAEQVADAVPGARFLVLEGQDHAVLHHPAALVGCLRKFIG